MTRTLYFCSLFVLLVFFISCNKHSKDIDSMLIKSRDLIELNSDSAILLLDTIPYYGKLSQKQINEYRLLEVQAKDKSFRDISTDTAIFHARDYFEKKEDIKKSALANFYCARVYQSQQDVKNAMKSYLRAETFAKESGDTNLNGLIHYSIGYLDYKNSLYQDAIEKLNQAAGYFSQLANGYEKEIASYNLIGSAYLIMAQNDSAFSYYEKGLVLARSHNDLVEQSKFYQNLGVAYRETGDLSKAKEFYFDALALNGDENEKARIYLNLSRIYNQQHLNDSTAYYVNLSLKLLEKNNNSLMLSNLYNLLSKTEEDKGNYQQALIYYQKYRKALTTVMEEEDRSKLLEIQRKYNFELAQNQNNKLLIEKQNIFLFCMFLIVCGLVISFLAYRKYMHQKSILLKERADLLEAEQQILYLKEMADSFNEKEKSLRNEVLRYFDILKKVALIDEGKAPDNGKGKVQYIIAQINRIVYDQADGFDWDVFFKVINTLYGGIINRMRQKYSQLDETEFKICFLSYARFKNFEMAIILKLATNTIHQKKSIIRRKLGISEHGNLFDFFTQNLNEK